MILPDEKIVFCSYKNLKYEYLNIAGQRYFSYPLSKYNSFWRALMWYDRIIDSGMAPDFILKAAVRFSLREKTSGSAAGAGNKNDIEAMQKYKTEFVENLKRSPVALRTDDSKHQHYEVPSEFFNLVLGSYMKYSCGWWADLETSEKSAENLNHSETAMLELSAARAEIKDGMSILDLGCGWGSFSIYLAQHFPESAITAVSHSATQKKWIDDKAASLKLRNIRVITADMIDFEADEKYDRIVSIEMFEHMRNWKELFGRISRWLKSDGQFFMHIFTTEGVPWFYDADNDSDWMAKNFFAGGMMPASDLVLYFAENLHIEKVWKVSGRHYAKTLLAWLHRMDRNKKSIMPVFQNAYGSNAVRWWNRWRLFFLSCAVFFGHKKGSLWNVTHYLLGKNQV